MFATRFVVPIDGMSLLGPWLVLFALFALLLLLVYTVSSQNRTRRWASVALGMVGLAVVLQYAQAQSLAVELTDEALVLHGQVQARIERSQVLANRVKVIDVERQPSFTISRPLNAQLGRMQNSGWAVLSNGMVVYALVGEGKKWLMVPTPDHYYLAISVRDLEGFERALQRWASAASTR